MEQEEEEKKQMHPWTTGFTLVSILLMFVMVVAIGLIRVNKIRPQVDFEKILPVLLGLSLVYIVVESLFPIALNISPVLGIIVFLIAKAYVIVYILYMSFNEDSTILILVAFALLLLLPYPLYFNTTNFLTLMLYTFLTCIFSLIGPYLLYSWFLDKMGIRWYDMPTVHYSYTPSSKASSPSKASAEARSHLMQSR